MTTAENVDVKNGNGNAADADATDIASTPPPPPPPQTGTTCPILNPHTQIPCGQAAVPSTGFCTHHAPGRVPCPVDPRHFVSAKKLKKHVGKCNATKRAAELASCAFYRRGSNRGRGGIPTSLEVEAQRAAEAEAAAAGEGGGGAAGRGSPAAVSSFRRPRLAPARRRAAEALGREKLLELLRKVREAADGLLPAPEAPSAASAAPANGGSGVGAVSSPPGAGSPRPASGKHDSQNAAIVGAALSAGVFGVRRRRRRRRRRGKDDDGDDDDDDDDDEGDNTVAVIELGAGRGYLGAAAADALVSLDKERNDDDDDDDDKDENDDDDDDDDNGNDDGKTPPLPLRCSALVLVDRRSYRNKAERHYRGGKRNAQREEADERTKGRSEEEAKKHRKPAPPPPTTTTTPFSLSRATVDLADVSLSSLPGLPPKTTSMALLGKHLCGPATDFSLRAAVTQLRISPSETETEAKKRHALSGLAVATCCHHCCAWGDFCGKREFLGRGFTADEFEIVAQCSAWATGGHGRRPKREEQEEEGGPGARKRKVNAAADDDDAAAHDDDDDEGEEEEDDDDDGDEKDEEEARCWQTRIPIDERRRAGDAAKRLLDGCRVLWLRRHSVAAAAAVDGDGDEEEEARSSSPAAAGRSLLSVEARPYAPEGVTGENRLIVAVPIRGRGRSGWT